MFHRKNHRNKKMTHFTPSSPGTMLFKYSSLVCKWNFIKFTQRCFPACIESSWLAFHWIFRWWWLAVRKLRLSSQQRARTQRKRWNNAVVEWKASRAKKGKQDSILLGRWVSLWCCFRCKWNMEKSSRKDE